MARAGARSLSRAARSALRRKRSRYLGSVRREQGRMEEAREYFEQALAIVREVGDQRFEGFVSAAWGSCITRRANGGGAAYYERPSPHPRCGRPPL